MTISANTNIDSSVVETSTSVATTTIPDRPPVLPLTLRAQNSVTWDANVQENEGMGRKSSKRCCIFHKQRDFGESSTDSSDESDGSSSSSDGGPSKKSIARRKRVGGGDRKKNIPNSQRYHA